MNAQSHNYWWSTLKSAVFVSSLTLPPLGGGGGQVWVRQICCQIILTATSPENHLCLQVERGQASLVSLADSYGGPDPMGICFFFLRRTADVLAPSLNNIV